MRQKPEPREESEFKLKCFNYEKLSRGRDAVKWEGIASDFRGNKGEYGIGKVCVPPKIHMLKSLCPK